MKACKFICFTGIDGAGKTTLASSIVDALNNNGIKAMYSYSRYIPFLAKPAIHLAGISILHNKDINKSYSEYSSSKRAASSKYPRLAKSYQYLLIFDYLIQIFFKITVPLVLGKTIICDRYIYDTVATDLVTDFDYSYDKMKSLLNQLKFFCPTPSVLFLIDLPEEVALSRKTDVPSIDYLKDRRRSYLLLARIMPSTKILDGCKNPDELKTEVLEHIMGNES